MEIKLLDYLSKLGEQPIKHALLVVVMLLLIFAIAAPSLKSDAHTYAKKWLSADYSYLKKPLMLKYSSNFDSDDEFKKKRLQEQFNRIRDREKTHLNIMIYFYERYYMAISISAIAGIIAAVALLFISKSGWSNANTYVVTVFLVTSSTSAYFGAFPTLFEQKKNIDNNKSIYKIHAGMEQQVLSYVSSGKDSDGKTKALDEYILKIDDMLAKNHQIAVELNPAKIPDPTEALNNVSINE
jgi:hypothetical protein